MHPRISTSYNDILSHEPDILTDQDLLSIPLSTLSKSLDLRLSHHSAVFVYLRWLEIHRQEDTKATQPWATTCLHWCQGLRNRGFSENELVHEVEKWREGKVFLSMSGRYPPSPMDIAKAYHNIPDNAAEELPGYSEMDFKPNESDFAGTPPPAYVCNRCAKKGHYLQVCPTNLDPSFDVPPHNNYQCSICGIYGDHYKTICALNRDPNCISEKRKKAERDLVRLNKFRQVGDGQQDEKYHVSKYQSHDTSPSTEFPSYSCRKPSGIKTFSQVSRSYRATNSFEAVQNLDTIEIRIDRISRPTVPKEDTVYSNFVQELIKKHECQMTVRVNQFKGRRTAIDMWEPVELDVISSKAEALSARRVDHYVPERNEKGRLTPYDDDFLLE